MAPTPSGPRRRRLPAMIAAIAALVAMTACGTDDDNDSRAATAGLPDLQQDLQAETWLLDGPASTPEITKGSSVTMRFEDERLTGSGPCNTFGAAYSLDGDSISIDAPISTRRACVEEDANADERAFLDALSEADTVDMNDDRDGFTLEGDGVSLSFSAFDTRDALEGTWSVVNFATSDALEGAVAGTDPSLTFDEDTVEVVTGCNGIHTGYTLAGEEISFEPAARTMMACEDPPGVMAQENGIAAALDDAATVSVTPDSVTLLDADGKIRLVATKDG